LVETSISWGEFWGEFWWRGNHPWGEAGDTGRNQANIKPLRAQRIAKDTKESGRGQAKEAKGTNDYVAFEEHKIFKPQRHRVHGVFGARVPRNEAKGTND